MSAAKIFFSKSRQLVKCGLEFRVSSKWVKLWPVNSSVQLLCPTTHFSFPYDDRDTSRDLCVTRCCQNSKLKFTSFFSGVLASVLLSLVFGGTAYCGENDENEFSTPGKQPFYRSRTAKAAKRRARTEIARAERCKRRLFTEESDVNDPSLTVLDSPVLQQREKQAHQSTVKRNNKMTLFTNLLPASFFFTS